MNFSRRQFVKGGVTAFTFGFAAPQLLCDIAFAQGVPSRNLVVVYLSGGNDSLSTVIPYRDPFYASRRPTLAIPAGNVLQIGTDSSGVELGLHPRLTGLRSIFDGGRLAIVQRTGYANQSRSHFTGFDIWGTASTTNTSGTGWLGRYLDLVPAPVDPLVAWSTVRETPRPLMARTVGVPAITSPATYAFSSPNTGAEATFETHRADADLVAPSRRSSSPRVREFDDARRRSGRWIAWPPSRPIGRPSPIRTTDSGRR